MERRSAIVGRVWEESRRREFNFFGRGSTRRRGWSCFQARCHLPVFVEMARRSSRIGEQAREEAQVREARF